jgi:hypothetical protein
MTAQTPEAPAAEPSPLPRAALALGVGGLVPFIGLAGLSAVASPMEAAQAESWLVLYAVTIVSFLGGTRWGLASAGMGPGPTFPSLALSVLPPLWAWATVLIGPPTDLWMLVVGLIAWFGADVLLSRQGGAPVWWLKLRLPLTIVGALSLVIAALT